MASQDDFLTTQKNQVSAFNGLTNATLSTSGKANSGEITGTTQVSSKAGFLVSVSVIVGGSSPATIYDSSSTSSLTNRIMIIPATIGLVQCLIPVANGIVVVPGSGMVLNVIYS